MSFEILLTGGADRVHHGFVDGQKFASVIAEAIHCAALDEVFHGSLIELALPHSLKEFLQRFERAVGIALCDNTADQASADILDCAQTEADAFPFHGERVIGMINVRRQGHDAHALTLVDIAGDLGSGI